MTAYLETVFAILRKDMAVEWRSRQLLAAMLIFTLLVILIFNFALELDARARSEVSAGVLWATFAFAGTLGLSRTIATGVPRVRDPCSSTRSRPRQDQAYSPTGPGESVSRDPPLRTGTSGYTFPVENTTMRESAKCSATRAGTTVLVAQVISVRSVVPNFRPAR